MVLEPETAVSYDTDIIGQFNLESYSTATILYNIWNLLGGLQLNE